jgi:hypothetical protein
VELYVDKRLVALAVLGSGRPDIAKLYPDFPNSGNSGWNVVLNLSSLVEGEHQLVVQIKSKEGNTYDLPATPFRIVHK